MTLKITLHRFECDLCHTVKNADASHSPSIPKDWLAVPHEDTHVCDTCSGYIYEQMRPIIKDVDRPQAEPEPGQSPVNQQVHSTEGFTLKGNSIDAVLSLASKETILNSINRAERPDTLRVLEALVDGDRLSWQTKTVLKSIIDILLKDWNSRG